MGTTSFTQLNVWKKAHEVALAVYKATQKYPSEERFGLCSQMRNAAVSIASNIAEGYGRRSPRDKARFYNISEGSAEELKYHLILSRDLGYLSDLDSLYRPLEDVSRMLRSLTDSTLRPS